MRDIEKRIIAVVASQSMKKQELIDYLAIEGWKDPEAEIDKLAETGWIKVNTRNNVTLGEL